MGLELNLLGGLEVVRDGQRLSLPPSRKTRALLAYLALQPRPFRREHLCELLWEVPDDPRGSLRWSLSKLRRLVDEASRPRILADRTSVAFDPAEVCIDAVRLIALVREDPGEAPLDVLEDAASRYRGHFLEGLELSSFHDFHAWCVAERENLARAHAAVLHALVERLGDEPECAVPHARALVTASPYDEAVRARLIRMLVSLQHSDEAEEQYHLGRRMLAEAGLESDGSLYAAWRGAPGGRRTAGPAPAPTAPGPATVDERARLIGRDAEMARLAAVFSRVTATGDAELVLLRGEPGMGKSRLLATVGNAARDTGAWLLEANAIESETIRPFALWIDALRRLRDEAAADIFATDTHRHRDQIFGALSDLIHRQSAQRPVVLLFDDVQWCDESSVAALHYVARMNRHRPLLAVLAGREGELHDNVAVQQALRGLRHEGLLQELAVEALPEDVVRTLITRQAPDVDAHRLCRQCAGNPLLAIELARAENAGDSGSSLTELIRERLGRFELDSAEVVLWASVLAPRINLATLSQVSGLDADTVARALEQSQRHALMMPGERGYRFCHDLLGRGVYNGIPPARRQVMHRRVAVLLEQDTAVDLEHAADLAHHAAQSGDPALAARAMVSAGRLCLRFFASSEARSLASRGLQLLERLPPAERVRLEVELNDVLLTAAPPQDWESAARHCETLAERALDHGAMDHARQAYHLASYLRWAHGHWSGAREQTLQAERVARGGSETEHIVGMAETAKCLAMLERDLSHAEALVMEAGALAKRRGMTCLAIAAASGILRYHENRLEAAEELLQEARTLAKGSGDRTAEFQAHEYLVMIAYQQGRYEEAERRCNGLLALAERLREGSEAPFARAMNALCRYALTDHDDALTATLDDLRAADAKFRLAYILTRTAMLDLERERNAQAVQRAVEALHAAEVLERATETLLAHLVLAKAHAGLGDQATSRRHAEAIAALEHAPVAVWARVGAADLPAPIA